MLSVLGSVGIFSALGVKSTLIIMEVIPFLVLAVSFHLLIKLLDDSYQQNLYLSLFLPYLVMASFMLMIIVLFWEKVVL